uniref:Two component transcriptional regulator, winged helix family n=1 Tax=Caulobacter sp. (strain K31) TaxID=366602 RepID=B0T7K3_CAUSK
MRGEREALDGPSRRFPNDAVSIRPARAADPSVAGYKVDISRGQRIGRVSSEWFSRPDDERYLSLGALYAAVHARAEHATSRTVETRRLRVEADRDGAARLALIMPGRDEPVAPTHWSFGQLCGLVGAPAGYLRDLPAPLAGINLQHGLLSHRAELIKTLETDDGRVELRAVTGPDYGRIWDHELVAAVMKIAGDGTGDTRWKVPGLRAIVVLSPDAVVLDLGLPDIDGKDVLARARAFYQGPILILSARDREVEKIAALDNGANDYVEKPFGIGEFLARLRAALRQRGAAMPSGVHRAGEVEIDLDKRLVRKAGEVVKLSPREYEVLARLAQGQGKAMTHKELLVSVWGPAHMHDTQYLRVFVGQVRQKLEADPSRPKIILTEAGIGYRFMGE